MSSAGRADRSPEIQRLLEEALNNQTASWGRGERTLVEDYLARQPALRGDNEAVLDLIYHEFLLRRKLEEGLDPHDYCARFPELAESLMLQFGLDAAITVGCESPGASERALGTIYRPMECIGDYQILDLLGRGGMAVVYKARDLKLGRIVALKMIAAGGDASAAQLDRFRSEAQAVARLRHPNIIAIYAIGEHENRPYLTLELAAGGNLSEKLSEKAMAPRDAAVLLETLARAVHAAHQAGIVHRDLKPSNILLASDGVPKVGDFGLARLLDADSKHTMSGEPVGTPSYMAPEQAAGQASRAGPEADVYALGAILYQTLTARPPFLGESALETLKLVVSADVVAPRRLRPDVPHDLETICLKCLEKEPQKRYPSALALADDLERFLGHRPILARPVGPAGRLWRWGRRNPRVAGLSAAVLLCLVAGTAVSIVLAIRATNAEAATRKERDRAQEEAQISTAVKEFLEHDLLAQASAFNQSPLFKTPDPDLTVRTALDRAAEKIGDRFAGKPMVEASIRQTVGETYGQLGLFPQAVPHLKRALELRRSVRGGDDPETFLAMKALGALYLEDSKLTEAEPLLLQALDGLRKTRSHDDLRALETAALLGVDYQLAGKTAEAEALLSSTRQALLAARGPDDPRTLEVSTSLGLVCLERGQPELAEQMLTDALARSQRTLGADHPFTVIVKLNLFDVVAFQGRSQEAAKLLTDAIDLDTRILGRRHPHTLRSMVKLGCFYAQSGSLGEAERLLSEALEGCRAALDRNHETTEGALAGLANIYSQKKDMKQLGRVLIEATEISRHRWGSDDVRTAQAAFTTGMFLLLQREFATAEPYIRESREFSAKAHPDNPDRWLSELNLGVCLVGQKKYGDAQPWLLAAYNRRSRSKNPQAPRGKADLAWLINHLLALRDEQGQVLAGPAFGFLRTDPAVRALVLDLRFPSDPFASPVRPRGALESSQARARPFP